MSKSKKVTFSFITVLLFVLIIANFFIACNDVSEETENNYPVVGVWHAQATWHEDTPYNYGGYTYKLNNWFDFREDGTLKNKRTLSLNGHTFNDHYSDWTIVNATWSVKGNVITLSSGKQYVIIDDEFNDTYPNPQIVLHYQKETSI